MDNFSINLCVNATISSHVNENTSTTSSFSGSAESINCTTFHINNVSLKRATSINATINNCVIFPSHLSYMAYTVGCCLLVFITILLNVHGVYAYHKRKVRQTRFNLTLAHLSASNTLQSVGFLPYLFVDASSLLEGHNGAGIVARLTCGTVHGLSVFFAFTFCNGFIVALLSVHRYKVVRYPLSHATITNIDLAKCWIGGVVWLIPNFFTFQYKHPFCYRDFNSFKTLGQIYKMGMLLCGMVFPLVVMLVTYVLTVRTLIKRTSPAKQKELNSRAANKAMERNRRSVTKTLGVIVGVTFTNWLPFGLYFLLDLMKLTSDRDDPCEKHKLAFTYKLVLIPSLLRPFWNVVFYSSFCKHFRKRPRLKSTLRRC